jgi:flagellar hook-associated protein 3 FlgL
MIYNQLMRALQHNQEDYAELNSRLATEKKILKPSDDVIGTVRALDYRVSIAANNQYKRNIDGATNNLKLTDTVLTSLSATLSKIKTLAFDSLNATSDPAIQTSYAQEAGLLRDHLYGIANTKIGDRYLFAGFRTNQRPYAAGTYTYQGDNGIINAPIDNGAAMPVNVTGNEALSYIPAAAYVKQITGGLNVHYTPGAGTAVDVEIRDAADTVVLDTFTYSNSIQVTDLLGSAISTNDRSRIEALIDPLNGIYEQLAAVQSDVGSRLSSLNDQTTTLTLNTNTLKNTLSVTEDADMTETAMQLQKANTTLQALYASSTKILSQSLLDFLK